MNVIKHFYTARKGNQTSVYPSAKYKNERVIFDSPDAPNAQRCDRASAPRRITRSDIFLEKNQWNDYRRIEVFTRTRSRRNCDFSWLETRSHVASISFVDPRGVYSPVSPSLQNAVDVPVTCNWSTRASFSSYVPANQRREKKKRCDARVRIRNLLDISVARRYRRLLLSISHFA